MRTLAVVVCVLALAVVATAAPARHRGLRHEYLKPKYTDVFLQGAEQMSTQEHPVCYGQRCPYPDGICCAEDHNACCPKGYKCNVKKGEATQCVEAEGGGSAIDQALAGNKANPVVTIDLSKKDKVEAGVSQAVQAEVAKKEAQMAALGGSLASAAKQEQIQQAVKDAVQSQLGMKGGVSGPIKSSDAALSPSEVAAEKAVAAREAARQAGGLNGKWRPKQNIIIVKNINVLTHGIRVAGEDKAPAAGAATAAAPAPAQGVKTEQRP